MLLDVSNRSSAANRSLTSCCALLALLMAVVPALPWLHQASADHEHHLNPRTQLYEDIHFSSTGDANGSHGSGTTSPGLSASEGGSSPHASGTCLICNLGFQRCSVSTGDDPAGDIIESHDVDATPREAPPRSVAILHAAPKNSPPTISS